MVGNPNIATGGQSGSFLINTGLEAGAGTAPLAPKAVSTAFLILPAQSMALDEFLKLVGEGPYPMMLLLPGNAGSYLCDI